ncbi:MAG: DUF1670 domain-containing protein [Desulfobulbaceae bacterium]|nr:DUF1670 domain-containing protein [Desulfobulbaceae bacterium]
MLKTNPGTRTAQLGRLDSKTQDHQLMVEAVKGAGISAWEAEVLVDTVKEVYFSIPGNGPLMAGQTLWTCVSNESPHGKPLDECEKKTVALTIHDPKDYHIGQIYEEYGPSVSARMQRICRITEEAINQGGVLSQEDLAEVLLTNVRTIRRDIAFLRDKKDILVRTRGVVHDIGPSVTHKGKAISLWLGGQEPVEVARSINHSLKAVERYLQNFSRCVFLKRKEFNAIQIAMTVGISCAAANDYLTICQESKSLNLRLPEIDCVGASHYESTDAKKGILTSSGHLIAGEN